MSMDDGAHLLRLLSLVFKDLGPNSVVMRFSSPDQEQRWQSQYRAAGEANDAAVALHMLAGRWAGALAHFNRTGNHRTLDADDLPSFALEAISYIPREMQLELGAMIQRSLGMF